MDIEKASTFHSKGRIRSQADQLQRTVRAWKKNVLTGRVAADHTSLQKSQFDISSILHLKYIHFHFGRIEKQYYEKFEEIYLRQSEHHLPQMR